MSTLTTQTNDQHVDLGSASLKASVTNTGSMFEDVYKTWLDDQNAQVEKNGLWCEELRVW